MRSATGKICMHLCIRANTSDHEEDRKKKKKKKIENTLFLTNLISTFRERDNQFYLCCGRNRGLTSIFYCENAVVGFLVAISVPERFLSGSQTSKFSGEGKSVAFGNRRWHMNKRMSVTRYFYTRSRATSCLIPRKARSFGTGESQNYIRLVRTVGGHPTFVYRLLRQFKKLALN